MISKHKVSLHKLKEVALKTKSVPFFIPLVSLLLRPSKNIEKNIRKNIEKIIKKNIKKISPQEMSGKSELN